VDLIRTVTGSLRNAPITCDISGEIVAEKKTIYPQVEIDFSSELRTSEFKFFAASLGLYRCISNLLENAIESCFPNTPKIKVRTSESGANVQLSISDNGRGIPYSILKKVGTRGFSFGKGGKGSGLGLFYVRESLKGWGASLNIANVEAGGTLVTMTFPKLLNSSVHLGQRIVLVENDESVRKVRWRQLCRSLF
jgi:signal transduction histidine kinase